MDIGGLRLRYLCLRCKDGSGVAVAVEVVSGWIGTLKVVPKCGKTPVLALAGGALE